VTTENQFSHTFEGGKGGGDAVRDFYTVFKFSLPVAKIASPFQEVKSPDHSKSKPGLFFIEYLKIKTHLIAVQYPSLLCIFRVDQDA
jgi:hypothetical protein